MRYDIQDLPEIIFGNNNLDPQHPLSSIQDINVSSGIYLDFCSDSSTLSVSYEIGYKAVKKYQSPIMTNGFSYLVRDETGNVVKAGNCYSWKGGGEETIVKRNNTSKLHYLFFLPSFNVISAFSIIVDDSSQLFSERSHNNLTILIGSSIVSGEGCSFPNSTVANILVQKINRQFISLYIDKGSTDDILKTINQLRPGLLIVDLSHISSSDYDKSIRIIKTVGSMYDLITICERDSMVNRIKYCCRRGKVIGYSSYLDEYSYALPGLLNDRGHYILSDLIIKEISYFHKDTPYDCFDIFDLKDCIYGAPNIGMNSFKKIYEEHKVLEENNELTSIFVESNEQTSGVRLRFKTDSTRV